MEYFSNDFCSFSQVRQDFERNGITTDLDEMDKFIIECRRKKNLHIVSNCKLNPTIEKVRSTLSSLRPLGKKQCCVFCRKNQEKYEVFSTHLIRGANGEVTCPILQKYVCPMCGSTGREAHTIKYCPLNDGIDTSTTSIIMESSEAVLRTTRNCAGKKRSC